ncbi:MAG: tubulin-like doman-containing protein [Candidatus Xenobium sp.]|jgi:hypothetical protein
MKLAVAPTVFIGLGGTGTLILQKLRKRMEHRIGTADLPFLRYLYVDTHKDSVDKALQGLEGDRQKWSAANVVAPPDDVIRRVQDPNLDHGVVSLRLRVPEWFDERMRQRLSTVGFSQGVGGQRMFSHLAFLASGNLAGLRQALIDFHQQLITSVALQGQPLEGLDPSWLVLTPTRVLTSVRFVVVTSAGGGTGSGCFIDVGFLLRRLRRELGWPGQSVTQVGHAALARPGVSKDLELRNTAALLTELDHYDGSMRYEYSYLTDQDGVAVPPERNPPFDQVYLSIPAQQARPLDADPARAFNELQWKIAEHLLTGTVAVYRDEAPDETIKLPSESSQGAIAWQADAAANNPKGFFTFGVSSREWPAAMVTRHLFVHLSREQIRHSSQVDAAARADVVTSSCRELGIPEESIRRNRTPRIVQEDQLCQGLLQPVAGFEPLTQLANCKARAFDDQGQVKPGGLVETLNALKEQFQTRHGGPVANQSGITYAIVQTNRDRLLAQDNPESLPQSTATRLLQVCAEKGPATALAAAREIRQAVAEELAFLEEGLEEVKPQASQTTRTLEECWNFANSSLLRLVLESKRQVYKDLEPWLEKLARRFENFAGYLEDYQGRLGTTTESLEKDAPGLVLPASEIERLKKALATAPSHGLGLLRAPTRGVQGNTRPGLLEQLEDLVRQGLPDLDSTAEPTLFASGPPKQQGAADYLHLQEMERQAFERVTKAQGEANPYNLKVLSLLKKEASEAGRPFPNLFAEAEPLIQFQGNASDYLNLSFGKAGTQCSLIVQANQDGYPDLMQQEATGKTWLQQWPGGCQEERIHETLTDQWSPWSVTCAVERCSIKTHLLTGYDLDSRQTLLYAGSDQPDWFPAIADRRIKLPPTERALEEAASLLFGSIILGRWTFLDKAKGYEFRYERQDNAGRPIPESYRAVSDMNLAARDLAHRPDVCHAIKRNVGSYLGDKLGLAAENLRQAVDAINERRLQNAGERSGDLPGLQLYEVHYDRTLDGVLRFCTAFEIPLPTVPHEYARFLKTGEPRPGQSTPTPQGGWYCTRCGHLFGVTMPGRTLDCPSCGNPSRLGGS